MMEPSEYKERDDGVGDSLSDLRVREKSDDDDDIGLSRLKVNVRRQDSTKEEVYLGKFRANKVSCIVSGDDRRLVNNPQS